jgi:hypothetical protein
MSDRPPLPPVSWELIELVCKRVDVEYWGILKTFQVHYEGPATLSPVKTPALLLNRLELYAGALFRAEGDQYPKDDPKYGLWLNQLAARIIARILRAVDEIEGASPQAKLSYHGLATEATQARLEAMMATVVREYVDRASARDLERQVALVTVSEQLNHYRDEFHLTLEVMAEAAAIDPRNVSRHLAGETVPRPKTLVAYERLFSKHAGKTIRIAKRQSNVRVERD